MCKYEYLTRYNGCQEHEISPSLFFPTWAKNGADVDRSGTKMVTHIVLKGLEECKLQLVEHTV